MVGKEEHSMPGRFKLVGELRDPGDIVRHGHVLATSAREDRKITRRCEVRTEQSSPPGLQFDAQQRVLNLHSRFFGQACKAIGARAFAADALTVDVRQPGIVKLGLNLSSVFFGSHDLKVSDLLKFAQPRIRTGSGSDWPDAQLY